MCSTLALMLLPINLGQAQAATVTLGERNVRLSLFAGADGAVNGEFTAAQHDAIAAQLSQKVLAGASVTRVIAVRAQFVQDNGANYPYRAANQYQGQFLFKPTPALPSLAITGTSQWHLIKVNGPENATGWAWNTLSDTQIRNRIGTARNWTLPDTNASSIHATQIADGTTAADDDALASAQDSDMSWPGVYLIAETGQIDESRADNPDSDGLEFQETALSSSNQTLTARAKAYNRQMLQYRATRVRFVDPDTKQPITAAPDATFKGGDFSADYTNAPIVRKATKTTSRWEIVRLSATSAQNKQRWYWNTDDDDALLARIAQDGTTAKKVSAANVDIQLNAHGDLLSYRVTDVEQPGIYMAIERGTKDDTTDPPDGGDPSAEGGYYGFAYGATRDSITLGLSDRKVTDDMITDPTQYMPAFCYNQSYGIPVWQLGDMTAQKPQFPYSKANGEASFYNLVAHPEWIASPYKERIEATPTTEAKGALMHAWMKNIIHTAYATDFQTRNQLDDTQLYRAVGLAIHLLNDDGMPNSDDIATGWKVSTLNKEVMPYARQLLAATQHITSADQAPGDDQVRVTMYIPDANAGKDEDHKKLQNMLTYLLPVQFRKVDADGKDLAGARLSVTDAQGNPIKDADGNEVAAWASDGTTKSMFLPAGTYRFREETAPNGYQKVEDFTFSVTNTGKTTLGQTIDGVAALNNGYVITDEGGSQPQPGSFTLHKRDAADHARAIDGARFQLWHTAPDAADTIPGTNGVHGTMVAETTAAQGNAQFTGIAAGEYYLVESQAPDGYMQLTAPIRLTMSDQGNGQPPVMRIDATGGYDGPQTSNVSDIAQIVGDDGAPIAEGSIIEVYNKQQLATLPLTGLSSGLIAWILVGVFLIFALCAVGLALLIRRRAE
ncbi:Cna protein B-type domain-containing protein [Bifidobacterium italicum]|uniref:Cna protein B-type domain-containing protein n=2 Tax=Bifidobacterium italicum TaxID=1960968 RepID=A0A2A2EM52_9BIFI|nr:Cna protein B-type domain-containing protein [Bifidobacterium italicum]